MTEKICCICGRAYTEWGNNADPVADRECCDACNWSHVIPARIKELKKSA